MGQTLSVVSRTSACQTWYPTWFACSFDPCSPSSALLVLHILLERSGSCHSDPFGGWSRHERWNAKASQGVVSMQPPKARLKQSNTQAA